MPSIRLLLLFCCFFIIAGCSNDSLLTVSGSVSFDGVPIKEGAIAFMAEGGNGSGGSAEIVDGKYTARVSSGKMIVQIYGQRDPTPAEAQARANSPMGGSSMDSGRQQVQFIPEKFNAFSTLRADIQKPQKNLDFALSSE